MRKAPAVAIFGLVLLAGCGSKTTSVQTVALRAPVAAAGGPYAGTAGTSITFSAAASSDPQGLTLVYAWNFGDGGTGVGVAPAHTYAAAGTYTVSLTVTSTSGLSSSTTVQVVVTKAAASVNGVVYHGTQPIAGAHVYLFAANNTGYGQASISLMNASATGRLDAVGAYVLSASDGGFVWTGDYSCTPGMQVYAYAQGGAAAGVTNTASGLMAAMGTCPGAGNFNTTAYVWINEVSTIAAAYAFSGFATDATHVSSSGSALAQVGIANAFANAANLTSLSTGAALAVTPAGNGSAPQNAVNTLANILAACVGSNGPSSAACSILFLSALSNGSFGTVPSDTAGAAINIAHNPGAQVSALFSIAPTATPFAPALFSVPTDFTLAVNFTGAGIDHPASIAIDSDGNAWVTNLARSAISEISSTGVPHSSSAGYTGGGLGEPYGIAIDLAGNAWVSNNAGAGASEFSSSGMAISPSTGFASCGGTSSSHGISIDKLGNAWFANRSAGNGCVVELSSAGIALSPAGGFGAGYLANPYGLAVDSTGAVWVTNQSGDSMTKLSSSGAPLSPPTGFTGGGMDVPYAVAIDSTDNVWVVSPGASTVTEMSSAGVPISPHGGFRGGGLYQPEAIAIDGAGKVWVANYRGNSVSAFANDGTAISPPTGFTSAWSRGPDGIAVDGSGDVWVASYDGNSLVELIGAATPVVTPLAAGVRNNALGTRP